MSLSNAAFALLQLKECWRTLCRNEEHDPVESGLRRNPGYKTDMPCWLAQDVGTQFLTQMNVTSKIQVSGMAYNHTYVKHYACCHLISGQKRPTESNQVILRNVLKQFVQQTAIVNIFCPSVPLNCHLAILPNIPTVFWTLGSSSFMNLNLNLQSSSKGRIMSSCCPFTNAKMLFFVKNTPRSRIMKMKFKCPNINKITIHINNFLQGHCMTTGKPAAVHFERMTHNLHHVSRCFV